MTDLMFNMYGSFCFPRTRHKWHTNLGISIQAAKVIKFIHPTNECDISYLYSCRFGSYYLRVSA